MDSLHKKMTCGASLGAYCVFGTCPIPWRASCLMDAACVGAPIWQVRLPSAPFTAHLDSRLHNVHKLHNEERVIFRCKLLLTSNLRYKKPLRKNAARHA